MFRSQYLYNYDLIQKAEKITFETTDSFQVMQRAAKSCFKYIVENFELKKTLILCGPGNNGGDGVLIAQHLIKENCNVHIYYPFGLPKTNDSKEALSLLKDNEAIKKNINFNDYDLVIDSIFGTGLNRKVGVKYSSFINELNKAKLYVISIDVPTGILVDNGQITNVAVQANITLTLHRFKAGQWLLPGKQYCGKIIVLDIGLTNLDHECSIELNYPKNPLMPNLQDHKFSRGTCCIVAGENLIGASKLACLSASQSALRAGNGLCKLLIHESQIDFFKLHILEEMLLAYKDVNHFIEVFQSQGCDSIIFGCGLDNNLSNLEILIFLLKKSSSLVLDATAFTIIQENKNDTMRLLQSRAGKTIMTPHKGEFKRIFNVTNDKINDCIIAAKQVNSVIVYKGNDTVIGSPNGNVYINADTSPYLATAGSGDVLAGLIGSFLSQGLNAIESAQLGCYIHAQCGMNLGAGLISSDLISEIPKVLKNLGN